MDPDVTSVLIVGACQAGVQIATSLRELGFDGAITMVSAESHQPYQRPPLSKALLKGQADVDSLYLRSPEFYKEQRIELLLGARVTSLLRTGDRGHGIATTADGRLIPFDRLALAVGSRPRRLRVPGSAADGVLYLRDADDARDVARTSLTGAATVVLSGIGVGLESAVYTAVIIGGAVYLAFLLGGGSVVLSLFLIALAGCGLLTTVGVIVAMDTFGPVSDNAQGIAEMSGDVDGEGAQILTDLDAVGNTTKAITKGIAIATAVLAATALFGSYSDAWRGAFDPILAKLEQQAQTGVIGQAEVQAIQKQLTTSFGLEIVSPNVLVGLLIGAAVVFLFSGLAINAVTRAAGAIVFEVRRQFRDIPGIMEGTARPEYGKVVDICTKDSLRELATPGLLAALMPVAVGFGLGIGALAGFLAGAIGTGALMAVFLANSGGAWDNAKKIVEDGHFGGKGSDAHAATVIGDTVGDPFKDTAGPAINPLIKVMNLVSVLIAPAIVTLSIGDGKNSPVRYGIAIAALVIVIGAVAVSKSRDLAIGDDESATRAGAVAPDTGAATVPGAATSSEASTAGGPTPGAGPTDGTVPGHTAEATEEPVNR